MALPATSGPSDSCKQPNTSKQLMVSYAHANSRSMEHPAGRQAGTQWQVRPLHGACSMMTGEEDTVDEVWGSGEQGAGGTCWRTRSGWWDTCEWRGHSVQWLGCCPCQRMPCYHPAWPLPPSLTGPAVPPQSWSPCTAQQIMSMTAQLDRMTAQLDRMTECLQYCRMCSPSQAHWAAGAAVCRLLGHNALQKPARQLYSAAHHRNI